MFAPLLALPLGTLLPHVSFPQGGLANEQMLLRWIHIVSGIIWIGLLYFFNLVGTPTLKQLEPPVRGKVFLPMMTRGMWWFRWSALVTVLAGLRYFWQILSADARNAGDPALAWRWMGGWLLVWLVAFALLYPLQLPSKGILNNPWVRSISIGIVIVAAAWDDLILNSGPQSAERHPSLRVGGGLGLLYGPFSHPTLPPRSPRARSPTACRAMVSARCRPRWAHCSRAGANRRRCAPDCARPSLSAR